MMKNSFKLQGKAKTIVTATDRRPCFHKIISSECLSSDRMCIPPDFKKHIVKDMSNRVLLKDYGGGSRYVRLIRGAGNIFLKDGWPEFVQEHALGNNEFLLFTYEGKACFSVQIFDINGLERVISKSDPTRVGNIKNQLPRKITKIINLASKERSRNHQRRGLRKVKRKPLKGNCLARKKLRGYEKEKRKPLKGNHPVRKKQILIKASHVLYNIFSDVPAFQKMSKVIQCSGVNMFGKYPIAHSGVDPVRLFTFDFEHERLEVPSNLKLLIICQQKKLVAFLRENL